MARAARARAPRPAPPGAARIPAPSHRGPIPDGPCRDGRSGCRRCMRSPPRHAGTPLPGTPLPAPTRHTTPHTPAHTAPPAPSRAAPQARIMTGRHPGPCVPPRGPAGPSESSVGPSESRGRRLKFGSRAGAGPPRLGPLSHRLGPADGHPPGPGGRRYALRLGGCQVCSTARCRLGGGRGGGAGSFHRRAGQGRSGPGCQWHPDPSRGEEAAGTPRAGEAGGQAWALQRRGG
jgi:hypothetical protein